MKTHHGNPHRGFPYRKVARQVVKNRLGKPIRITGAETRRMALEALAGLRAGSRLNGEPDLIDLRDLAFSLSTALADEIEKALLEALKIAKKPRRTRLRSSFKIRKTSRGAA